MSFIASAITNPGQLIALPLTIFQAAFSFAMSMAQQAGDFAMSMMKTFV
jgi:hypothetical protein